VTIIKK